MINDHKAIGGSSDLSVAYFWGRIMALTAKTLMASIAETVPIAGVENTLIESNTEDEMIRAIDTKKELDKLLRSLKEPDYSAIKEDEYTFEEDMDGILKAFFGNKSRLKPKC